jgi:hypothetical protein
MVCYSPVLYDAADRAERNLKGTALKKNAANKRLTLSKETLVNLQEFVVGGLSDWCTNSGKCTVGTCVCPTTNLSDFASCTQPT